MGGLGKGGWRVRTGDVAIRLRHMRLVVKMSFAVLNNMIH